MAMLKPTLIRFPPHQMKWLKRQSVGDGQSAALTIRGLVHNAMIDDGTLEGTCEQCARPIFAGTHFRSDAEGCLLCAKCMESA